jgi:hypothetical protein
MDIFKKKAEVVGNKKSVKGIENSGSDYIVYFLNDSDDIVYIGRKNGTDNEVVTYVVERADKYFAVSFYSERIAQENPNDAHAERVLMFEPIFNKHIPQNDKFISINQAKEKYRIGKREFGRMAKQHGSYSFGSMIYMLKSVFDDEVGMSQPFDKNMPKEGNKIIFLNGEDYGYMVTTRGYWDSYLYNRKQSMEESLSADGSLVTTITESPFNVEESYNRLQDILNNSWTVFNIIDYKTFIAKKGNDKMTLSASEYGIIWTGAPSFFTQEDINSKYFQEQKLILSRKD